MCFYSSPVWGAGFKTLPHYAAAAADAAAAIMAMVVLKMISLMTRMMIMYLL